MLNESVFYKARNTRTSDDPHKYNQHFFSIETSVKAGRNEGGWTDSILEARLFLVEEITRSEMGLVAIFINIQLPSGVAMLAFVLIALLLGKVRLR